MWEESTTALRALLGISTQLVSHCEEATTESSPTTDTVTAGNPSQGGRHQVADGQSEDMGVLEQDAGLGVTTGVGSCGEGGERTANSEEERGGDDGGTVGSVRSEEGRGDGGGVAVSEEEEEEGGGGNLSDDSEEEGKGEDSVRKSGSTNMEEDDKHAHTLHWRCGQPHPKAERLLLRLATEVDVKERGAAKKSTYYKKYGNPLTKNQTWKDEEEGGYGVRSYLKNHTWRVSEEGEEQKEDLR